MLRVTLKNFWAHKRRLIGTMLAIVLGVAFLSGTAVLSDSMRASFGNLFTQVSKGTDAKVRSSIKFQARGDTIRGDIPASALARVRAVAGVANAVPEINGLAQIVGRDGKTLGGNGPPTLGGNWIDDPNLNPFHLVSGRSPRTDDEVVIDKKSADQGGLTVGSSTQVLTPGPVPVRIVGIAKFGSIDNAGGATFVGFTLDGAQRHLLDKPGRLTSIAVHARPGVSQQALVDRIRPVLPPTVEVITGKAYTKDQTDAIGKAFLDLFTRFLEAFAGISLVVATFSIYNTFSILVAQRSRESALLRALGGSRGQILWSVLAETLVVGLIASLLGFAAGLGVASGLKGVFGGGSLPGGLVVKPGTFVTAVVVGVVVTVLAGLLPAVRAARIPPLAAMREVAVDRSDTSRIRLWMGTVLTALGLVVVAQSTIHKGNGQLPRVGGGALALMVGVIVLGPVVARPASRLIGAPVAALRGVSGRLARQNAMRNPRRTSGTAAALMVGVAVVTLFTVFGASVKESINRTVTRSFGGDLVIGPNRTFGPPVGMSPALVTEVDRLPQVRKAVGFGNGFAHLDGRDRAVAVADPQALAGVIDLQVAHGDLATLTAQQIAVSQKVADARGWHVGSPVPVTFSDGASTTFRVGVIYGSQLPGDYLLPQSAWSPHATQETVSAVLVVLKPGVPIEAGRQAVQRVSDRFPGTKVQDRKQYASSIGQGVDQLLAVIYVMLLLAVIIALMGIANTLSLSVYERTRELGLLRAVGQTRRQMRTMVRWEAILISTFGTVGGLLLGTFFGWSVVRAASSQGIVAFAAPVSQLGTILVVGAVVGVLAAILPARRAARLDVLRAISAE